MRPLGLAVTSTCVVSFLLVPWSAAPVAAGTARHTPVRLTAPCSEKADLEVKLSDVPDRRADRLRVTVSDAVPDQRWRLGISVTPRHGPLQVIDVRDLRTNASGHWSTAVPVATGRQRIAVDGRGRAGERCRGWLSARVSDRSGQWEPPTWIAASAPCSGTARVGLRLSTDPRPHRGDRLAAWVRGAEPDSRWRTHLRVMSGDNGSVTTTTMSADDDGAWRWRDDGGSGLQRDDVLARDRTSGQRCAVGLEGRVAGR